LGLAAAAAASPAAALGQPAAALPGGGDWQPRPAFDAGDKEVELAWARDLGAEPPLDLDELPPAQTEPVAQPVIAEVIPSGARILSPSRHLLPWMRHRRPARWSRLPQLPP